MKGSAVFLRSPLYGTISDKMAATYYGIKTEKISHSLQNLDSVARLLSLLSLR